MTDLSEEALDKLVTQLGAIRFTAMRANHAVLGPRPIEAANNALHQAIEAIIALRVQNAGVDEWKARAEKAEDEVERLRKKCSTQTRIITKVYRRVAFVAGAICDEGDRLYFGSSNDADILRDLRDEWDAHRIMGDGLLTAEQEAAAYKARAEKAEADMAAMTALKRSYAEMKDAAEAERDAALARVQELEAERDNAVVAEKMRMIDWCGKRQWVTSRAWQRAARKALDGDMVELRNRIDLVDAGPLDIVQSDADLNPPPDAELDALVARLRGQDPIPSRTEVADAITALRARKGGA